MHREEEVVGVDERGDEGGERVVISEAQLAHRHRVVLVHHRDHAQLEERLEGRLAFGFGLGLGLGLGFGFGFGFGLGSGLGLGLGLGTPPSCTAEARTRDGVPRVRGG